MLYAVKFGFEFVQSAQAFIGFGIAFIGEVVSSARKSVNCMGGFAQAARHNERADGEIFVMVN